MIEDLKILTIKSKMLGFEDCLRIEEASCSPAGMPLSAQAAQMLVWLGQGWGVCVKEHQTSSGLSKQRRSSSGAVCGLIPRELERRKRQKGKPGCFFCQLGLEEVCSLGAALAAVCPQAQPGAPPQSCCSQALGQQRGGTQGLTGPCECGRGKGHQNPSCSASTV